jgi:hypothetical protein
MSDELSGDGMIILDGESIATVYYWLTVVPEPGAVIAGAAKLALVDGPTLTLRCHGGRGSVRWVKALRP